MKEAPFISDQACVESSADPENNNIALPGVAGSHPFAGF
jgi:hypothetical protein